MASDRKCLVQFKRMFQVLLFTVVATAASQAQYTSIPQSPCPEVFTYRSNGYEYYGMGQIPNPPIGQDIHIMAHMIIGTQLSNSYYGKLQFIGSPEQIVNDIYSNKPIIFEILFPTQNPLPVISSITVNDQTICQSTSAPIFNYMTKVTLQYMFKPVVSPNFRPRPQQGGGTQSTIFIRPPQVDTNQNDYNVIQSNGGNGFQVYEISSDQGGQNNNNNNFNTQFGVPNRVNSGTNVQFTRPPPTRPPPPTRAPTTTTTTTTTTVAPVPTAQPQINYDMGCGKIPKKFIELVVGGETIQKGDWPWLVAIHYYRENSFSFRCGGTIISKNAVLSAAHCFYSRKRVIRAEDIIIFLGHYNLKKLQEDGSKIVNVNSIITHPEYMTKSSLYSDIAIAKVADAIEFSELIQPVCLWSGGIDLAGIVGRQGVLVGWGRDENGNLYTPEPKRVQVPIVSDETCLRSNEVFVKITSERTFCAGWRNGTDGPCAGDSGTGLMLNQNGIWYIRGVVSSSLTDTETGSCNLNEYVVFSDVAKFLDWIQTSIA